MSRRVGSHAAALGAFVLLAGVLTQPIALRMGSVVRDPGDPLLNSWILARNVQSLRGGNLSGFFDANIFFPAPNTLAYSEFLIPQTVVAAPVLLATGNPILAYNTVLLLALVTAAFGMYLLASRLNGWLAGFVAGLIFAFCPFMMGHLSHLQVLSAAGIPLAFLFLQRYFDDGRTRDLLLFSITFVLQALANAYYAMYLTLFAGLAIAVHAVRHRRYLEARFWRDMAIHTGIVLVTVGPLFVRYLLLRRDLGFIRAPFHPATMMSFLTTPRTNWLYGAITGAFRLPEGELFPGALPLLLAATGVAGGLALGEPLRHTGPARVRWLYRMLAGGAVLGCAVLVAIFVTGGFELDVFTVRIGLSSYRNPMIVTMVLLAAWLALKSRYHVGTARRPTITDPRVAWTGMLALAFLLTIPGGPSELVREHVPGFNGLRAVSRMHVMSMAAIAVLASYGVAAWRDRLARGRASLLAATVTALILLEYASVPIPVAPAPVGRAIPPVYRWLADQPEDFALVEYPIRPWSEVWQVYFSIYHRKRLVNGYSGYVPPPYVALRERNEDVPSPATLDDLEAMGVRYLIVQDRPSSGVPSDRLEAALGRLSSRTRLVQSFDAYDHDESTPAGLVSAGRSLVYELTDSDWRAPQLIHSQGWSRGDTTVRDAAGSDWTIAASPNPDLAALAVDGDLATRWHSNAQTPGDRLELDLGRPMRLNGLLLDLASHEGDYPRGYRVELSRDGQTWSTATQKPDYRLPITELLRPTHQTVDIRFPAAEARYLRIVQTSSDRVYWWSVNELHVTTPTGAAAGS